MSRSVKSRSQTARSIGQLCREVERTLTYALAAAADPRLRDVTLVAVEPSPDPSCVQVTVIASDIAELAACLERARGALRAELARSLQRKRTPDLRFVIVPR